MKYNQKGNIRLLDKEKWGILASRIIRPHITQRVLKTIDRMNELEYILISGWHSPIEEEIHQYLVRRNIAHIHIEAKGLSKVTCDLGGQDILFISHCPDNVTRINRSNALKRNKLVCELSDTMLIPWLDPKGKTHALVQSFCEQKSVIVFDPDYNKTLVQYGAKSINEFPALN